MNRSLVVIVTALLVPLPWWAPRGQAGSATAAAGAPVAVVIKGETILSVTRGSIPNGTIVLRDGKIAAIGTQVDIPPGAEVVDASGRFVSPGIVDCHTHMAADSIATINEGGTTVSSMVGIEDVLNPTDVTIYRALAGGVTTANVLHGSVNAIGGKNAVIKLRWGKTRGDELLFQGAMPGIKFALGENVKGTGEDHPRPRRYPTTRPGIEYVIREAFTRAKAYRRQWQEYEGRKRAGEDVLAPRRDLQLEPLVEVLEGKRLVHVHSYRADEILMLIRLAEEMGFKVATFQHALEGYKVAKEIAAHGAGASIFADWWGFKVETMDGIPYNAALMTRRGVTVSINSDLSEYARRLNTEAAKSIKWGGLTDDEAFALVTINPARQLRIDRRVGSLEVGKDADVVIWTHHPLSSYALADRVYIDGILYYDRQADARRILEIQTEKERLVKAERDARPAPAAANRPKAEAAGPVPSVSGGDQAERPPAAGGRGGTLAITNARIHPVTTPEIERGAILVRDGLIADVGANVSVPAGTRTIDAGGADVYPGWINARSTIGLADPGPGGYADTEEMLDFNPQLHSIAAFHNDSDAIPIARANGVTTVAVTPAGGILGGEIAVMNLDGWTWEESEVRRVAGLAFSFPTIAPPRPPGGRPAAERSYDDLKKERDAKLDELAGLLGRARAYAKARITDDPRRTDLVLEALLPIVERRLPLITRADREPDIRDAVAFADRVNVRIVISGGIEAPLVATLLKERGIPVILGPVLQLPTREDSSHAASYAAAGQLARAGVKFAFATGDTNNVRLLPYHAARAVAWGLPHDEAIRALTIDAAEILGVGARLGSIEPGKIANLVIVKGDPLEVRTEVLHVVINGRDVGLANRQLALYERYKDRP